MNDVRGPTPPVATDTGDASEEGDQKRSRKACKKRPPARPRPLVSIKSLTRVLLRQAEGPAPEKRLVVAVICLALGDTRSKNDEDRRSALDFLEGPALDCWASWVGLDGDFIRELARKARYLSAVPEFSSDESSPSEDPGRKHVGLQ